MIGQRASSSLRRLIAQVVPVVIAIATLNFCLLHLAPGDAADIIAAQSGGSSAEFVRGAAPLVRARPPALPTIRVLCRPASRPRSRLVSTCSSGRSSTSCWDRVPATLPLMLTSMGIALAIGIAARDPVGDALPVRRRRGRLGPGAGRLRDAAILARADADRPLLDHLRGPAVRRHDDDRDRDGDPGPPAGYRPAPDPAGRDARALLRRALCPGDALVDARDLRLRLRQDRAGEGSF